MTNPIAILMRLLWQTIRAPRRTGEEIVALNLPLRVGWEALVLSALLTVLLVAAAVLVMTGGPLGAYMHELYPSPLMAAAGQVFNSVVTVFAMLWIGRWLGGYGRLEGAVALMAWYQFFGLCTGLALIILAALLPWAAMGLGIGLIAVSLMVLTQFICALHGFRRPMLVFTGMVGFSLGLLMVVSLLTRAFVAMF